MDDIITKVKKFWYFIATWKVLFRFLQKIVETVDEIMLLASTQSNT